VPTNTILVRDHLEQAALILRATDTHTVQLRYIIEQTICLIDEFDRQERRARPNVIDFQRFRISRQH
jgi:hypothetical protein